MIVSTFFKRATLVAAIGLSGLVAGAQTFSQGGLIYKISKTNVVVQKAGTKVTVGEAGPTAYEGEITVPETVDYNGKTYKVSDIASAFRATNVTKVVVKAQLAELKRGAFQNDSLLEYVELPNSIAKFTQGNQFDGCVSLKEITIPGSLALLTSTSFKDCVSMEKITFAPGDAPITVNAAAFSPTTLAAVKEVVIMRQLSEGTYTAMTDKPFRAAKALEKVTIGGTFVEIPSSYFEAASALTSVTFLNEPTSRGTNVFAGTAISEIALPASITAIPSSTFQGCPNLTKITLGNAVTSIGDMAFYNSHKLSSVNFPAELKTIGQMAFSGADLQGTVALPENVTSVGVQAFANNKGITSFAIPAATKSLGEGAFMGCSSVAKFDVAAANEAFKAENNGAMLVGGEGRTILAVAPKGGMTALTGSYTKLGANAAYQVASIASVDLPYCTSWGDYSVAGTGIKSLTVQGQVGRYVAAACPELTAVTINGGEAPFGIVADCPKMQTVTFAGKLVTIKQDAFKNCPSIKNLDFGSILAIIEADAFKGCGVETITVGAAFPAAMAQGVFTEANSNITVKVPNELVDTYKNAAGWSYLNVVGDASVAKGGEDMGMPAGLYFASPDGNLYCAYDKSDDVTKYDVGGVPHTFQLAQFKNRIYGASAGKKFVYSATGAVDGDGKLFYISKVGGETFQAVVLDNAGNNAYKDPFGIYIYGDTLYVNDRNVCIRKISADAIALPQDYPSWMENNWMAFYGAPWSYGCIKSGWAITKSQDAAGNPEPEYWVGMKYNGNGIFRFKQKNIGNASVPGPADGSASYLNSLNPIFTTVYIDEAHGHMYIYIEKAGGEANLVKGGIYRINIADLEKEGLGDPNDFNLLNPVLIDGSPVRYEGSGANEHVGITQFSADEKGEYLYWCYRAPTAEEAATNEAQDFATMANGKYWWAEKYDAANPLHQTGIKRIKLGEAQPKVEMVKAGLEGYGVVPVNYEGSVSGVNDIAVEAPKANITIAAGTITAGEDAVVYVYDMNGAAVAYAALVAGQSMSIDHLPAGAYIATANGAAVKFVK